jgi:hypothetical protein
MLTVNLIVLIIAKYTHALPESIRLKRHCTNPIFTKQNVKNLINYKISTYFYLLLSLNRYNIKLNVKSQNIHVSMDAAMFDDVMRILLFIIGNRHHSTTTINLRSNRYNLLSGYFVRFLFSGYRPTRALFCFNFKHNITAYNTQICSIYLRDYYNRPTQIGSIYFRKLIKMCE